ncbi:MAG TPA: NADH-quinone oxidoreductase subunit N [Acidimicrobiia bacterium]|nr:NADH-quinone oxidoreductase subunit N [Acidimicrobiia bacterium]
MITPPEINWLAILPLLVLGLGAAVVLLVDVQWKPAPSRLNFLAVVILGLAALGTGAQGWWLGRREAGELAGSPLPFGGMVVIDRYAIFAGLLLITVAALGVGAGAKFFESLGRRAAEGLALLLLSTSGFILLASTTQMVMMFLGLEIGSISLYVIAGFSRQEPRSEEAAIKYFLLGSFASAIFVYGVALVFAGTGSLDLLEHRTLLDREIILRPAVLLIGLGLVVVGLAFKVTAAPFHAWAPDVYQGAPAGTVGFMAALAKVGGFAALARVLVTGFESYVGTWGTVVAALAVLSMLLGSFLAVVQSDLRRLLAYSGVAHAGFILTGVVAGTSGVGSIWFYLAVYAIQLVGAYAVVAAVSGAASAGSPIASYAGLARRQPLLAQALTILLLGMAGIPLTSGFIAKFGVFQDAFRAGFGWLVVVAMVASVVSFFIYLRVIVAMYMQEPEGTEALSVSRPLRVVLVAAIAVTLVLGLFPIPLLRLTAISLPL